MNAEAKDNTRNDLQVMIIDAFLQSHKSDKSYKSRFRQWHY